VSNLKVGLIGASFVAASRMLPAFRANRIPTRVLFDTDERRFRHWRDSDLDLLTSNLEEFLASDIDAVYISSRNDEHASQAMAAARAGKHILLEKPMALTLADARAVVVAAEHAGVQLAVNHHLPGSPLHATARQLVAQGRIGSLYSARINHAVLLPESLRGWRVADVPGGGVVLDITVHDASVLNRLFGAAASRVTALGVSQASWNLAGTRDSVMTILEYPADANGIPRLAQTHDAFTVPYPGTSMEIHGERGAIVISDAMTQDTPGTVELHTAQGIEPIDVDCSDDLYHINVRAFVAAIRGEGRPTATGAEGLGALQVAIAVEESLQSGQAVVLDDMN
jgi:1,5-anhydro-D-fructose reductase (1,5-anhydro-D-mannitol-forming)